MIPILWTLATPAMATWAIVATDPDSGMVGAAGATCGGMVWYIAELVPGEGAVVSMFATKLSSKHAIADALGEGTAPEDALAVALDPQEDADLAIRQFAVAGFAGDAAVFTGEDVDGWTGTWTQPEVAILGNTLVDEAVLTAATAAWISSAGSPLEERLLVALEGGAAEGGDSRCTPDVAAKSAFVMVATADEVVMDLTASDKHGAVAALREKVERGKTSNMHCNQVGSPYSLSGLFAGLAALLAARRRLR